MQQFIPFEDEWDALEKLRPEDLVPYRVGLPCTHGLADGMSEASPSSRMPLPLPPVVSTSKH